MDKPETAVAAVGKEETADTMYAAETTMPGRDILRGLVKTATGTTASRILGLVRDVVTARIFGAGIAMDMFVMAFQIPNLFRRFFGEGALSSAFVPVFTKEEIDPGGDQERFLNSVMSLLGALLLGVTIIGWAGCAAFIFWGNPSEKWRLFSILLMIVLPYLPAICLTAVQCAALNVKGCFLRPAMAPMLMNICWIAASLWFGKKYGVQALAWGATISGIAQFLWQAQMLRSVGFHLRFVWKSFHPGVKLMLAQMLPVAAGVGVMQLNTFADQLIAQFCVPGGGANSALYYGNHLAQFPLGVLGIAMATAVFPAFARLQSKSDGLGLAEAVSFSLRSSLFLSLPCMAAMTVLGIPIVRILFERGAFSAEDTARSAAVLSFYGLGLAGFCAVQVLARAFYARQDMRTPLRVAMWMALLNVALNLLLVWPMKEAGLALASSISGTGNAIILFLLLGKRIEGIEGKRIIGSLGRNVAAAVAGGAAGGAVIAAGLSLNAYLELVIALGAVVIVYACVAWLLASREAREVLTLVKIKSWGAKNR